MNNIMSIEQRFFSLVRTQVKKKRSCVRCEKMFMSSSAGKRICDVCNRKVFGVHAVGLGTTNY